LFTGIIEEKGTLRNKTIAGEIAEAIEISAAKVLGDTEIGDSICVSGVCLTVISKSDSSFTIEVMPETLRTTTLGEMKAGRKVNLERALDIGGRLGGHLVNGHVDGIGQVVSVRREGNAILFEMRIPHALARYVVSKGSIAVDGISLTVVGITGDALTVSIIPHTLDETTLGEASAGTRVNIEVDIIAKYVEAMLRGGTDAGGLEEALVRGGLMSNDESN
jgi:riboflavin synthase